MTQHRIIIYFDFICAWSYIGHRSLVQAIEIFQKTFPGARRDEFEIIFRPYYRDRSLPDIGVPLEQRLESALGPERLDDTKERVIRVGKRHGISFVFNSLIGNTKSCHRLVYAVGLSNGPEMQRALIEHIYFHWHEVGADITSLEFLVESAKAVGFPELEALNVLRNGKYADEVDHLDDHGRRDGVSCVPTFDINGTRIEGADDTAIFYELLVKAKEVDD